MDDFLYRVVCHNDGTKDDVRRVCQSIKSNSKYTMNVNDYVIRNPW
jgi:hypothetical protein